MSLDDLLGLDLKKRILYVRTNLATKRQGAREAHLSLDDFAAAVGAKNRQATMRWEKGATPRDYAERIAALTPYPPEAFGAAGEAEFVRESFWNRLLALEAAFRQEREDQDLAHAALLVRLADLEEALRQVAPGSLPETSEGEPG